MIRSFINQIFEARPRVPRFSEQQELKYRQKYLKTDADQATVGMFLLLFLFIIPFHNDYQFFGLSTKFYLLLALRIFDVAWNIIFVVLIRKVKSYMTYDRLIAGWVLGGLLVLIAVNLSRPADYYMFAAVDIVVVAALYLVFRSHFIAQTTLALALTLTDIYIFIFAKHIPPTSFVAIISGYILANGLGLVVLISLNSARRSEFLAREQEEAGLKAQRDLEISNEKESRLESIGVLAGGIAHDFNNALTGVIGNIDLAEADLQDHDYEDLHERLKDAMRSSERGKQLSKQLLTFARGSHPEIKTFSLPETIKESAKFALQGSTHSLEINTPDGLWCVDGDKSQISQVISNLVINARQATSGKGAIKITARNTSHHDKVAGTDGKFVLIQIEDNGHGISKNNLDRIFDPFFTTKERGHGLGLSVANSIVKKHHGFIEVESIEGAGSFFYVYLPASEKCPSPPEPASVSPASVGTGSVLIMDDDENIRILFVKGVSSKGYSAVSANDGAEAVALYKKSMETGHPFDAVVLDLTVPGGKGGVETLEELLKIDGRVTAIASSGYSDDPVMTRYKKYGFKDVLPKPYAISELLSVLGKNIQEAKREKRAR